VQILYMTWTRWKSHFTSKQGQDNRSQDGPPSKPEPNTLSGAGQSGRSQPPCRRTTTISGSLPRTRYRL
ncbi:hypothetical protein L210DRAFT_3554065, partial [Boletus edulis BED1]